MFVEKEKGGSKGSSPLFSFVFYTLCLENQIMIWVMQDRNQMGWDGTGQRNRDRNLISKSSASACLSQKKLTRRDILCSMLKMKPRSQSSKVLELCFQNVVPGPSASTTPGNLMEKRICGRHTKSKALHPLGDSDAR